MALAKQDNSILNHVAALQQPFFPDSGPSRGGSVVTDSQWMNDWMQAWRSFPGTGNAHPWTAAFDHFTKSTQAAYQQQFSDALTKITDQSRAFFELGETLVRNDAEGWQQSVFTYLDELAERAEDPHKAAQALAGVAPLDYWRQFAGHEAGPGTEHSFLGQVEKLLQMPGLGYTREHQESVQELSRRWLTYEKAYGEYAAYGAETGRRSIERLRERLREEFEQGGGPASIRELYDTWVECSEEVYAERARTEEYMALHGRMVNALMQYRQQAAKLTDQWAEAANLPTREEVDALHRKLKDARQELRAIKTSLARQAENTGKKAGKKAGKKSRKW